MTSWESVSFWITIGSYAFVSVIYLYRFVFGIEKDWVLGKVLLWVGFLANVETVVARSLTAGHLPVRTMYELNLVVAALAVGVLLWVRRYFVKTEIIGLVAVSFAFLIMGWGYVDSPAILALTPAYKSNWLVVHVLFGLLSTACFVFAAGASLFYILKTRYSDEKMPKRYNQLPNKNILEELGIKLTLFGFMAGTIMLVSGSIWAKLLWGQYWSWDPIETWSLLSWLIYGIYIHLRFTYGWRGKKLAILNIICFISNLISSWAVGLVTPDTYHTLEEITRPVDW